ncbi:major facilitator superfamily protein [Talaromyces proteolyticus]|uniref:Major facilitator superfamily protein n=1 Tax=Talaromyces proteolyticus TaxID=1131652 RepID=A0AAD4PU72_9EURO|nr:major facilitator superfamily protein [Talaromyces proteolyticus]KAH8689832.1 major facilitator superfamily protein [Talaromyces proteolyticus]
MEITEHNTESVPTGQDNYYAGSLNNKESDDRPGKTEISTEKGQTQKKGVRFWAIIVAICVAGLLTALEATITSTALPTIISDLGGADKYVWVVNGYFLTMTATQPLFGQLSNVFGRRWPTIIATAAFILGSGICGGADNIATLIAGRAIQGIGAGGINVMVEIIVCDLLPLRERGNYLALIFGLIAVGTALGPFFGGLIVQHTTWRWVFYLNLPVGGFALVLLVLFLRVKYQKETALATKLGRIDCLGDAIFAGSIVSTLIALSWAGTLYPWSSYHIILSLLLGLLGLVGFLIFEGSKFSLNPTMPIHLFSNQTSLTAFILTFLHSVVTMWALYFLPVYFQGVLGSTPSYSGVQLLPTILILVPFAATAGSLLAKFGRYRPIHHIGYALMTIGFGLFSLLDENSSTAKWVIFQVIESAGAGLIIPTLLPAVQAELTDADNALSTATWAFIRSFGLIWGTTIPAAIFNNRFDELSARISDAAVVAELTGGKAYEHATRTFLETLSNDTRAQVVSVFSDGLRRTWQVAIAFSAFGFLLVILQKEVPLRKELETEYGMTEAKKKSEKVPPTDENLQTEAQI